LLLLGDICSRAGREAVKTTLPGVRRWTRVDFVVANGENLAGGYGINPQMAEELFDAGVDCMTTGDHAFDRKDAWDYYNTQTRLLRPENYPPGAPGRGHGVFEKEGFAVGVINLVGRVFMKPLDCPFQQARDLAEQLRLQTPVVLVDFHAEATAEKLAMGAYLDGRVSAVLGTHTHVQTADEHILPDGTAYVTDVGMCGAFDSILGMRADDSVKRLLAGLPNRLRPATRDPRINGVLIEVDDVTGRAVSIERLVLPADEPEAREDAEQAADSQG